MSVFLCSLCQIPEDEDCKRLPGVMQQSEQPAVGL